MRIGANIADKLTGVEAALRIAARLPRNPASRHVARQLVREATGAGANYEEARDAESRADFVLSPVVVPGPASVDARALDLFRVVSRDGRPEVWLLGHCIWPAPALAS